MTKRESNAWVMQMIFGSWNNRIDGMEVESTFYFLYKSLLASKIEIE